jgi:hypothetical protein
MPYSSKMLLSSESRFKALFDTEMTFYTSQQNRIKKPFCADVSPVEQSHLQRCR